MSFTFARTSKIQGRRAFRYGLGLFSFGALSLTYHLHLNANNKQERIDSALRSLEDFKEVSLTNLPMTGFPWDISNIDDWEYKVVKVCGYFKTERIFVKKTKDGKNGFAVMAPFYYQNAEGGEYGTMVNLGWVPYENKSDISPTDEPLTVEDLEDPANSKYLDPFSTPAYTMGPAEDEEPFIPKYTTFTAIVRRGEKWNPLVKSVNFYNQNLWQFMDLDIMSRIFLFKNVDSARVAYLERIVPSLEEAGTIL